jgi:translocation and assembly module TamA
MRRSARGALFAAALIALLMLGGCAHAPDERSPGTTAAKTGGAPLLTLRVDAPGDLRALLQNNLDLARLAHLADDSDRANDGVGDTELARLIGAAPAQVRALLETEGYFDPVVQVRREPGTPPVVQVSVQPGPRTQVGELTFEVEGPLEQQARAGNAQAKALLDALRSDWPLQPGTPFRNPAWSQAKAATLAKLHAAGYATASWSGTGAQVDVAHDRVRLFVVVDSGPRFLAGPLVITGLQQQRDSDVRNLAGFGPGTPLTEQLMLDFQQRLLGSGLFDQANVVLDPDPAQAAHARVLVQVHEQSLQQSTIGLGYSQLAGPRISLEHWHRRAFDLPVTAHTQLEWGRSQQTIAGDLSTHARSDLWRDLVGYSIQRQETSSDRVTSSSVRLGRAQDLPQVQRLFYGELQDALRTSAGTSQRSSALWANDTWTWHDLDNDLLPTRGHSLSLQGGGGQAHDDTGRDGAFVRLYARAVRYQPLGHEWYGSARLELAQVIANGVDVPDPLLFRAGGDESVRGYEARTLAPLAPDGSLVGGKSLFTSSVELARPISAKLPSVWWAVFVDAGRAAQSFTTLHPAVGYGAGIRWRSPVGPLKMDLAYGNETHRVRLHLSVGIAF